LKFEEARRVENPGVKKFQELIARLIEAEYQDGRRTARLHREHPV